MKRIGFAVGEKTYKHAAAARKTLQLLVLLSSLLTTWAAQAEGLDLSPYRGKIVVVDFWASWCAPCRQSFPWLNSIQRRYADQGLVVLGVNVDRERAEAERFLLDVPAEFPMIYDPSGTLAAKYELPGMPTSLVFGPSGELLSTHIGFKSTAREEREAELVQLLQRHLHADRR